jgi:hypothetical protein
MKREKQHTSQHRSTTSARPQGVGEGSDPERTDPDRASQAREEVRQRQPVGAFDARAIRELSLAVPADPTSLRRTTRP